MRNYASYSMAMAGMGLLIGALTFSAALAGARFPALRDREDRETGDREEAVPAAVIGSPGEPAPAPDPGSGTPGQQEGPPDPGPGTPGQQEGPPDPGPGTSGQQEGPPEAVPEPIQETGTPGSFWISLQVWGNPGGELFLADALGCPIEPVLADAEGCAAPGPVEPGVYSLVVGLDRLGRFRLRENAALEGADGRLWTDGEVLYLEDYRPGTVEVTVRIPAPGLYSFCLTGTGGTVRTDRFVPAGEAPGPDGFRRRVLRFPGLPAGVYVLRLDDRELTSVVLQPGAAAEAEVTLPQPAPDP